MALVGAGAVVGAGIGASAGAGAAAGVAGLGGGKYKGPLKPQPADSPAKESIATMLARLRKLNLRITADSHKREDKDYERY